MEIYDDGSSGLCDSDLFISVRSRSLTEVASENVIGNGILRLSSTQLPPLGNKRPKKSVTFSETATVVEFKKDGVLQPAGNLRLSVSKPLKSIRSLVDDVS
eukprot:GHVH01003482.1.p1 GENE.GHVH01003482.1~~GHVH01003482.1.p1  ORF type:complete len:101 (+),score=12.80 GHVH01003482.1:188-490(+)